MQRRREFFTLLALYTVYFVSSVAYSILAPFFPTEAEKMGLSSTMSSVVFSSYSLVSLIASPFLGTRVTKWGRRNVLLIGSALQGIPILLFGFVTFMGEGVVFLIVCCFLRIVEGLGAAAAGTATFALVSIEFPEKMAVIFGVLETIGGAGMMIGPPIGGFLFEVGGFTLPFLSLGGILCLTVPALLYLLPKEHEVNQLEDGNVSLWDVLKQVQVQVMLGAIFFSTSAFSFLDPTLSEHLESFNMGPGLVGLMFMVSTLTYAVFSPVTGLIAHRFSANTLVFGGLVICGFSFVLLGPCPLLPVDDSIALAASALAILGVGSALIMVPSMPEMISASSHLGEGVNDIVSGVVNGVFSLGGIAGPVIGASVSEHVGFAWGSSLFGATLVLYALGFVLVKMVVRFRERLSGREDKAQDAAAASPLLHKINYVYAEHSHYSPVFESVRIN